MKAMKRVMEAGWKQKENVMKYKLLYTGLIFLIYILGKNIPLYGIDRSAYTAQSANAEEMLMRMISGDAYQCSIFALGIFPFMIAGILVQIALEVRNLFTRTKISPQTVGRASVTVTLVIGILQAGTRVWELEFAVADGMLIWTRIVAGMQMITGMMIILWLAGRNGRYGIGGRMAFMIVNLLERIAVILASYGVKSLLLPILFAVAMMALTLVMENAQLRIPVQRVSIHNIYADKNYLAIKLSPTGLMPVMFTSAVFMLPKLLISLLADLFPEQAVVIWWLENMTLTRPFGIFVYLVCEYLLTIGFAMIMINPRDITEQFLKSGDSIVNLHAGGDTRRYLRRCVLGISLFSATVMGACLLVPVIMQNQGSADSALAMLPVSVMLLTSFWCTIFRELNSIHKYDSCKPLFYHKHPINESTN